MFQANQQLTYRTEAGSRRAELDRAVYCRMRHGKKKRSGEGRSGEGLSFFLPMSPPKALSRGGSCEG